MEYIMQRFGIKTIEEAKQQMYKIYITQPQKIFENLMEKTIGYCNPVPSDVANPSIYKSSTFKSTEDEGLMLDILRELAHELILKCQQQLIYFKTITLVVGYSDFSKNTYQDSLQDHT